MFHAVATKVKEGGSRAAGDTRRALAGTAALGDERGPEPMETRVLTRSVVAVLAICVIVGTRLALADGSWLGALAPYVPFAGDAGVDLFPSVVDPRAAVALVLLVCGCLLLALVLPAPAGRGPAATVPPTAANADLGRMTAGLFIVAAGAGGASVWLLRQPSPGRASVVVWMLALAASGIGAWRLDRGRATPLGSPLLGGRDWLAALLLFAFGMVLAGHDVGHWAWAGTPDEGNFFPFALEIAEGRSHQFVLSETGMYEVHPLLSSYYQAAFMRAFGLDVVGWRLSSAFGLALSLPFLYLLGRELRSRRFGVWAAVLFATTPLALAFSHLGYNNSQVWPFVTGGLAAFAWAHRRRSALGYWIAGAISGFAVFTFYPARLTLPLVVVLALAFGERPWAAGRRSLSAVLLGAALLAALPSLAHPLDTLGRMFGQTSFRLAAEERPESWSGRVSAAVAGKGPHLARHWTLSLVHPLWYPRPSHFQSHAVVDPLQGVLALTGFFLAWRGFRRDWRCRFLAVAASLAALAVGSLSQHACPPLTRLLFLGPFNALLAALALEQALVALIRRSRGWITSSVLGSLVVAASAAWGVGILRHSVYVRHHGYGEGTTSEVVRVMRAMPEGWQMVFVQAWPTYMQSVDNFGTAYGGPGRLAYLRMSREILGHLPRTGRRGFVLAHDLPEGSDRAEVEGAINERFPGQPWYETAPGEKWNLRILAVGEDDAEPWQPPRLAERGDWERMLLGHRDW